MRTTRLRGVLLTVAVLNASFDRNPTQPSQAPSLLNANFVVTGITDLGTPGQALGGAFGINARGQVVGVSNADHATMWTVGPTGVTVQDLGTLGGDLSGAFGINAREQVVGISTTSTAPAGPEHAVLWTLRR